MKELFPLPKGNDAIFEGEWVFVFNEKRERSVINAIRVGEKEPRYLELLVPPIDAQSSVIIVRRRPSDGLYEFVRRAADDIIITTYDMRTGACCDANALIYHGPWCYTPFLLSSRYLYFHSMTERRYDCGLIVPSVPSGFSSVAGLDHCGLIVPSVPSGFSSVAGLDHSITIIDRRDMCHGSTSCIPLLRPIPDYITLGGDDVMWVIICVRSTRQDIKLGAVESSRSLAPPIRLTESFRLEDRSACLDLIFRAYDVATKRWDEPFLLSIGASAFPTTTRTLESRIAVLFDEGRHGWHLLLFDTTSKRGRLSKLT